MPGRSSQGGQPRAMRSCRRTPALWWCSVCSKIESFCFRSLWNMWRQISDFVFLLAQAKDMVSAISQTAASSQVSFAALICSQEILSRFIAWSIERRADRSQAIISAVCGHAVKQWVQMLSGRPKSQQRQIFEGVFLVILWRRSCVGRILWKYLKRNDFDSFVRPGSLDFLQIFGQSRSGYCSSALQRCSSQT